MRERLVSSRYITNLMERASIKSILFQASITSEERYGFKMSIFNEKSER